MQAVLHAAIGSASLVGEATLSYLREAIVSVFVTGHHRHFTHFPTLYRVEKDRNDQVHHLADKTLLWSRVASRTKSSSRINPA